jgi:hypothetical protein
MTQQPCDVTFRDRKPALDVTVEQKIFLALIYGAGARKLNQMLRSIDLSNGDVINWEEIWPINPMPKGGFLESELAAVDLAEAEGRIGPVGKSAMICGGAASDR